jgi:prolyl 4-hydroxylase
MFSITTGIIIFIILLSILLNYSYIQYVISKQGLCNIEDEYVGPEVKPNFINNEQCFEILNCVKNKFKHSKIANGVLSEKVRKSETAWISKNDNAVYKIIMGICDDLNVPFENAEDMQVVKYAKGGYYNEHHDSFPYYDPVYMSQGGHRILTALIYLNDDFEGGETRFVTLDENISPKKCSALFFHPLNKEKMRCHPKALHCGMPVLSGEKYVANIWIRENAFTTDYKKDLKYIVNSIVIYSYSVYVSVYNWLRDTTFIPFERTK